MLLETWLNDCCKYFYLIYSVECWVYHMSWKNKCVSFMHRRPAPNGRLLLWSSGACFAGVEWSLCPLFWCAGGVGSASTTRGSAFHHASFEHKYCESIHQIQNGSTSNSGSWKGTLFQWSAQLISTFVFGVLKIFALLLLGTKRQYTGWQISESASTVAHWWSHVTAYLQVANWRWSSRSFATARAKDQGRSPSQMKWIEMVLQQEDSWHTKSNSSDNSAWNYLSFVGFPITCPKSPLHVCS